MSKKKSSVEISVPVDQLGKSLYQSEEKVYPRSVQGRFARLRWLAVALLLGFFYLLPWIKIKGEQAVLFDLPARKFTILGMHLWPQDFYLLAMLLIIAGVSLFFFTALAGRIWCGYACPQTVWTELFMLVERWIEGDRAKRKKLDAAPWSKNKAMRKSGKQIAWIAMALFTGFTFVAYFTPLQDLWASLLTFSLGPWETFWVLFYSLATYGNAGFLREQVCKYMCPYARFQSAMFDQDTLIVAYDEERGEPRGSRKRGEDYTEKGLGACIDCTLCVQVCPTGIDIRKGLQYECIACAACIDVCDTVMDKMGYEPGLIKYTSENSLSGIKARVLRPRTIIYALLLAALLVLWTVLLFNRQDLTVDMVKDRNSLYQVNNQHITNVYTLRLVNKKNLARNIVMSIQPDSVFNIDKTQLSLDAEEVAQVALRVSAKQSALSENIQDITLVLKDKESSENIKLLENKFISPVK